MHNDGSKHVKGQRGKCLCSAVEFEVSGQLPNLYQCYGSLCQKQTGGSHNTATLVDEARFNWLKGQEFIKTYQKEQVLALIIVKVVAARCQIHRVKRASTGFLRVCLKAQSHLKWYYTCTQIPAPRGNLCLPKDISLATCQTSLLL